MLTATTACRTVLHVGSKQKLTVRIDESLIEQIKIRAVKEKRAIGAIIEELFREYLKRPIVKK